MKNGRSGAIGSGSVKLDACTSISFDSRVHLTTHQQRLGPSVNPRRDLTFFRPAHDVRRDIQRLVPPLVSAASFGDGAIDDSAPDWNGF
jgi:hypothetical protein